MGPIIKNSDFAVFALFIVYTFIFISIFLSKCEQRIPTKSCGSILYVMFYLYEEHSQKVTHMRKKSNDDLRTHIQ